MSGLEKEELQTRVQGMTKEEQMLVGRNLPNEIIWNEMHRRGFDASGSHAG